MANSDKLYLAYSGQLGEVFQEETKSRIEWIVTQAAKGNYLLDIGCSQGIVSLLLAEQGKHVTGLDIQPEAIEFAENLLEEKFSNIKESITFKCIDFMEYEDTSKYDCIIITEVLEHLQEPELFIEKAASFLKEDGKLIVSVPFGVMEHPDHFNTFFVTKFYDLISHKFAIKSFEFMERWMGITACLKANGEAKVLLDKNSMKLQEDNFEIIDCKMVTANYADMKNLYEKNKSKDLKNRYKELTTTIEIINQLKMKVQRLNNQKKELAEINEEYRIRLEKIESNIIWKAEIKIYRKLKILKNKILN